MNILRRSVHCICIAALMKLALTPPGRWFREYQRRHKINHFVALSAVFLILYNEYVSHWLQSTYWPQIPVSITEEDNLKVLFVTDPQLVGFDNEPHLLGIITRYDSDRYMRRTFQSSISYVKPDVVVFLGDLLDEGSISSDQQYQIYVDRFRQVFHEAYQTKFEPVFISGDNDVGGEGSDPMTTSKVQRFEKYFPSKRVKTAKFVDIIDANIDLNKFATEIKKDLKNVATQTDDKQLKIVINHSGILYRERYVLLNVIETLKPAIIFTSHTHVSRLWTCPDCYRNHRPNSIHLKVDRLTSNKFQTFPVNNDDLKEIVVPTCSYRMGVPDMGYGFAIFNKSGRFDYAVLWQVQRYPQLWSYLAFLIVASVIKLTLFFSNRSRFLFR
ncbi:metallophosphoesterase 1 homolog [Tubulanus polymorphus]|uniref:metallophosphoesterase 1 homolog n=1 Tax=Tubulanus polymorphus TaxID=672921 RepID=UPI003DA21C5D